MSDQPTPAFADRVGKGYRIWVLAILLIVYTFNFIDRQILGILAPAIKADLGLSDTQLGLMGGLAFALFYTGLGIPIGWLADRWSRTWIITIALALWSGFTALCGFAGSFTQLFLCRMGVGFGEAGGVAPSYSLISDYFPPKARARALAAYSFGIPVGGALGVLFGGLIASAINWRTAFIVVGLMGVLLVPLLRLTVKEPPRPTTKPAAFGKALAGLAAKPTFWLISTGAACSSIVGYGLAFWLPSFFLRSFHMSLAQTSLLYAGLQLFGGVFGIWAGGAVADRLSRHGKKVYVLAPACAFVLTIPFFGAAVLSTNPWMAFLLSLPPQALSLVWLGPVIAAVQHLSPATGRTTASAAFLFINNLIGIGCGTLFFGVISDALTARFGTEALRYAIICGLPIYGVAALLLFCAARFIDRDWVD
jgi:MFS family permease